MNNEELKTLIGQADANANAIIAAFEGLSGGADKIAALESDLAAGTQKHADLEAKAKELEEANASITKAHAAAQAVFQAKLEKVQTRLVKQRELNDAMVTQLEDSSKSYEALLEQRNTDIEEVDKVLRALAPLVEGE